MDVFDEELLRFWKIADQFHLKYIMIGGVATNLHGYQRTTEDIDSCLNLVTQKDALSVVSVSECLSHPYLMYSLDVDQKMSPFVNVRVPSCRQDLPNAFFLNGAIYYAEANWLRRGRSFLGRETVAFVMPQERSIEVDTLYDCDYIDFLLRKSL